MAQEKSEAKELETRSVAEEKREEREMKKMKEIRFQEAVLGVSMYRHKSWPHGQYRRFRHVHTVSQNQEGFSFFSPEPKITTAHNRFQACCDDGCGSIGHYQHKAEAISACERHKCKNVCVLTSCTDGGPMELSGGTATF